MKQQQIQLEEFIVVKWSERSGANEYSVWEVDGPTDSNPYHNHSSLASGGSGIVSGPSKWYGTIGSRSLPVELESLPFGSDRVSRVQSWQAAQYEIAYSAIVEAFPESKNGRRDMGRIRAQIAKG